MRKEYIGQNCPYCKTALVETDMIAVCGVCNVPQHLSCWQKNKGCTTAGCTGFINEIIESDSTVQTAPQTEPEPIEQPAAPLEEQKEKLPELLYESREMVFMSDLPIVLEHTTMTMDYAQDKLLACCTFRSITDKAIKAVVTQIICQDAEGHALGTPVTFRYRNLQTKRGTKFGQKISIDLPDHGTRKLRVTAQKVVFADDTEITGGDRVFTSPAPVLLSEHFGSSDLAAQYARETTAEAQFVPIGGGKYWFCTCGALNESFETRCHNCGCTKKQLVTALDPETLKINLSCYEAQNAEAERAEKAKAKKKQKKHNNEPSNHPEKPKKRSRKPIIALIIVLIMLAAVGCSAIFYWIPYGDYREACAALDNGEYDQARQAFLDLDGFLDSEDMALKSLYEKGKAFLDEDRFDNAIETFENIMDYEDSAVMLNEAKYRKGCYLLENKFYTSAASVFDEISDYKDSASLLNETKYQEACEALENQNFAEALSIFETIRYYKDSVSLIDETKYQEACVTLENAQYTQAVSAFENISSYKDSATKVKEAKYGYVLSNKSNDDVTTYEYLLSLKSAGYKDSATIYKELYTWKITVLGWNSDRDSSNYQTSISKYNPIYCHVKLTGGTPGASVTLRTSGKRPDGYETSEYTFGTAWRDGEEGWYGWAEGLYTNPEYGSAGTLRVYFYDDAGNKIGTASVTLTD